jgi:hypothetical protein
MLRRTPQLTLIDNINFNHGSLLHYFNNDLNNPLAIWLPIWLR